MVITILLIILLLLIISIIFGELLKSIKLSIIIFIFLINVSCPFICLYHRVVTIRKYQKSRNRIQRKESLIITNITN